MINRPLSFVFLDTTGYTRLRGALKNLGHELGRNTIKRLLAEHGIAPAPERGRSMSWSTFIKAHWGAIAATDLFTVEVVNPFGLVRYHVLFVIDIATRCVSCKASSVWLATAPGVIAPTCAISFCHTASAA